MNSHPISNNSNFKDLIYKYSFFELILSFLLIFFSFSVFFFIVYISILFNEKIALYDIFKFSLYQSFGFSVNDIIKVKLLGYESISFLQKVISVIINLVFTSSILLKYFSKPSFFQFKKKINIDDNKLIISLYNKTNFEITSCKFTIYARLPYKDNEGFNSLNNLKLFPNKDFFPFMDKHLVTRLIIDLNKDVNNTDKSQNNLNKSLKELLDVNKKFDSDDMQYLQISIIVEAISTEMDSHIYEIETYKIDINDKNSILENIKFNKPNSISIDMVDFSKSTGWDKFED